MRRGEKSLLCFDTLVLAVPLVAGAVVYGSIFAMGVGARAIRTFIWSKK